LRLTPYLVHQSLRNVVRARITTPIATARASTFWMIVDPESVPVTKAETNS